MYSTQVLEELSSVLKASNLTFDDNLLCNVIIPETDIHVTIETNEFKDKLFVCAYLGFMPEDDNYAAAISLLFTQENMSLVVKNKGILAIDFDGEGLIFVKYYDLCHWCLSDSMKSLMEYFEDAKTWCSRIYMPNLGLEEFVKDNNEVHGSIRV